MAEIKIKAPQQSRKQLDPQVGEAKPVLPPPVVSVDRWSEPRRWSIAIHGWGGRVEDQDRAALLHDLFEVARPLGDEGRDWLNKLFAYFDESEASCSVKFKKLRKWIDLKRDHSGHEPRLDRLRGSGRVVAIEKILQAAPTRRLQKEVIAQELRKICPVTDGALGQVLVKGVKRKKFVRVDLGLYALPGPRVLAYIPVTQRIIAALAAAPHYEMPRRHLLAALAKFGVMEAELNAGIARLRTSGILEKADRELDGLVGLSKVSIAKIERSEWIRDGHSCVLWPPAAGDVADTLLDGPPDLVTEDNEAQIGQKADATSAQPRNGYDLFCDQPTTIDALDLAQSLDELSLDALLEVQAHARKRKN